ncbi:ATP-grasp domain-containing protein [Azospirillum sp. YIM B02556]|uniref:ATP-grasp domain-containing protein n=1 Tax=Azospirillum endophyticum TaxID=2800326 RepID=A0ABS1F3J5_9PROT|nr:ATP-grasp domain-containing protein [Azospirillum endophyticum]MBK1837986.1 ATP-grasp domain-containing protein [Azospirillum endophyticum]
MPTALLVSCAMYRHGTARMPAALKAAGFRIFAICPRNSLLELSDHIDGRHAFSPGMAADDLTLTVARAAVQLRADIVVGCEESAVAVLGSAGRLLDRVAEKSADAHCLRILQGWYGGVSWEEDRSHCVERAAAAGIRTPRQVIVDPESTEAADLSGLGAPLLLKRDGSSAGRGVFLASDARQAVELAASLERTGADGVPNSPAAGRIVAQQFLRGRAASVSFCALAGRMLEGFAYSVLNHQPAPFGPASVIELADHPQLMDMARRMVELTAYSGFGGIDAILPEDGSPPVFLEFNARPTQTTHLGDLAGSDLCRAMACALTGRPHVGLFGRTAGKTIALFPAELVRDPNSHYLTTAHHDVPWNERRMTTAILTITPHLHPA